ncbi:MAG TPA: hypothetical protein VG033_09975 [Candidatus Acidoferrales bacterium]|nr:hypothetical protein [Candidatus Acidoferrales bacterium]
MKLQRIVILIAAIVVLAPVAALAQQPVASFHHRPSANSALDPKGPAPNLTGKWDILSTDANGDPYNTSGGVYLGPIEFTVDFTETGGSTLIQVDGNTFTSSACSADGTATVAGSFDANGNSGNGTVQFIATVDSGYTYTFSAKYNKNAPSQISGSWSTTAGACGVQSGQFTAFLYNPFTNSSYGGEFTSDVNALQVKGVTVNLAESNFAISGTISGPESSCFNGLTIDPTQSISTGGLVVFYGANASGALVGFLGSNMDSNYKQLPNDQPIETSLYITYAVYQAGGNCQAGDSGHDAVFHIQRPVHRHRGN